jgi:uncharacterized membrane protein YdcZ (DUF606 family)
MAKAVALILCAGMLASFGCAVFGYVVLTDTPVSPPLALAAALSLACVQAILAFCKTEKEQ